MYHRSGGLLIKEGDDAISASRYPFGGKVSFACALNLSQKGGVRWEAP
jgi:hypothetical protein